MTFDEVKAIFKRVTRDYEGQLIEYADELHYRAKNEICDYYTNGKVAAKAKVECDVYVQDKSFGIILGAEERTFSILGGQSSHRFSEGELVFLLDKYCFKKKTAVQMSLFDM